MEPTVSDTFHTISLVAGITGIVFVVVISLAIIIAISKIGQQISMMPEIDEMNSETSN